MIGGDIWSDEDGFAEATAASGITGICGSGIIEAVAELRIAGLMDENGLIGSVEATGTRAAFQRGVRIPIWSMTAPPMADRASP